jgi:hypothetical protein
MKVIRMPPANSNTTTQKRMAESVRMVVLLSRGSGDGEAGIGDFLW